MPPPTEAVGVPSTVNLIVFSPVRVTGSFTTSNLKSSGTVVVVPVVSVVVVQRAIGIDVADVLRVRRIRRNKMYPKRFTLSHDPAFSTQLTYTSRQAQV